MYSNPIIRLEIQGMKHAIQACISEHVIKLDQDVQASIEKYCSEGNIIQIIDDAVRVEIDAAVTEEIRNFFRYSGSGRMAIREALVNYLNKNYPKTKRESK